MTQKPEYHLSRFHHALHMMMRSSATIACLIVVSLGVGTIGYKVTEAMPWIDAFENASMILSGMGPAADMQTMGGKLFASFYALYSGLFLIAVMGAMLLPILHRMMSRFHLEEDEPEGKSKK